MARMPIKAKKAGKPGAGKPALNIAPPKPDTGKGMQRRDYGKDALTKPSDNDGDEG